MKNTTFFLGLLLSALLILGCEKYDSPTVTKPFIEDIKLNTSVIIGFDFTADAGYHSSVISAEKGTIINKGEIGQGAVQGIIFITYKPTELGTDNLIFTIKDNEGQFATSQVEVNIIANDPLSQDE